jgi:two-component system chemotaxis response regulator CheY
MKDVLIIDDSKFMSTRLHEILEGLGKNVVGIAANGKEGVAMYKELKPEFVFLDINMPELSGKDALLQIMAFDPQAFVIMCSTMGSEEIIAECIEAGAQYYVLKPFTRKSVEAVIAEVIDV